MRRSSSCEYIVASSISSRFKRFRQQQQQQLYLEKATGPSLALARSRALAYKRLDCAQSISAESTCVQHLSPFQKANTVDC